MGAVRGLLDLCNKAWRAQRERPGDSSAFWEPSFLFPLLMPNILGEKCHFGKFYDIIA